ncbi:MAG TPA: ATPase, T2SS/T4P/T4SS family [Thermoleophilaceae bacterium]|jgi:type IV pilus assembly protein PilB|nr:ATPase, T2SS/T4P/T4SS family [Thermoleophilaceae bacterium]
MSEPQAGSAQLRAVPAGAATAATTAASADGLTPPQPRGGSRFITDVVVEMGFLARDRVEPLVDRAKVEGRPPEQVLLEAGAITGDQLARATAQRFGLHHVDLTLFKADVTALNVIPAQMARRIGAAPIGYDDSGQLLVAMSDPSNVLALDDLKLRTGREVRPVVASPDDINGLIGRMSRLDEAVAEAVQEGEEELADVTEIRESAEDAPVIKLVNSIIAQAVEEGASDIHFEPEGREMRVRFRVDGVLRETTTIPRRMTAGVVSRVKIMASLDIAEKRVPQDGRVSLTVEGHAIDTRIVTMPRVDGEGIVMRILDKSQALIGLDSLGMSPSSEELFEDAFRRAYGAVLVTGPTGSGKSTTLYAALNEINEPGRNIITIEDPVEYQLAGINQLQVNLKAGLTFAGGLRAMLRADPDVIMVGEIRDAETAKIAIESALTGHLVLSTLHTNDAPSAITRLTEMGIEPFLSASAIVAVVAQRLVRQLCTYCKRRTMLSVSSLEKAGFNVAFDLEAYEPGGCGRCGGSGYKGRTGLYEVMVLSDDIRDLTVERASAEDIRKVASSQGMRTLRVDGFEKVKNGITSIAEVARVT